MGNAQHAHALRRRAAAPDVVARAASTWLAATSRPNDILFGYDPLFLGAWEQNRSFSHIVVPRADTKLALHVLYQQPKPLGRGVWVLDASDNNNFTPRLHIPLRYPRPASRVRGARLRPFLVLRSRKPTRTIREFLLQTQAVQLVGQSLYLGDSDINLLTVERALGLRGLDAAARASALRVGLLRERLAVTRSVLERGEPGRRRARRPPHRPAPPRGRDRCRRAEERAVHEGAEPLAAPVLSVHETIVRCSSARSETCSST